MLTCAPTYREAPFPLTRYLSDRGREQSYRKRLYPRVPGDGDRLPTTRGVSIRGVWEAEGAGGRPARQGAGSACQGAEGESAGRGRGGRVAGARAGGRGAGRAAESSPPVGGASRRAPPAAHLPRPASGSRGSRGGGALACPPAPNWRPSPAAVARPAGRPAAPPAQPASLAARRFLHG